MPLNQRSKILRQPEVEPVSAADVKKAIPTADVEPDDYIDSLVTVCRLYIEQMTGIAMISQEWILQFDFWGDYKNRWWDGTEQMAITELFSSGNKPAQQEMPRYPLISVDKFLVDGEESDKSIFEVDAVSKPGRAILKDGHTIPPSVKSSIRYEFNYTAGYGSDPADVPATLRQAIKMMVANMLEHRGDECSVESAYKNSGARELVRSESVRGL